MSSTSGSAWDHSNNGGGGSPELREALLLGDGGSSPESREIKGIAVKKQDDLEEIRSVGELMRLAAEENRRLWYLAGPAIFTSLAQYSLGAVTQVFAGHLTTLELDAHHMLGIYLQRSWVILTAMSVILLPIYLFATPILRFFHQDDEIAVLAGRFSLYMIPQLFAYALNFPIQKFLQAQSKVMAMAAVSAAVLLFHVALTWLLLVPLRMGLVGLAVALNVSWWLVVLGQLAYIVMGYCPGAWNGFDWLAFTDLLSFARLSLGSAIMICLDTNLFGWQIMVFFGFNAAISVRVSNELGAGRPRAARLAIAVVLVSSVAIGVAFFAAVLLLRDVYGAPFTGSPEVVHAVASLGVVFAFSLLLNSVQPVLSGVAVGAGWQWLVAYINLGCYYCVGIPVGYAIAFPLGRGVQGMWGGMLTGVGLQTAILVAITARTNWNKEASEAHARIQHWGGTAKLAVDDPI
uniref:Protein DETOXIFICATION n=1 Tax=Oryza glumipatula TaxID=40148 RepID=A0A0E0AYL4_9ORYZ